MNKSRVSIIVAMDEKRGIGKDDDLLFKIHDDFKRMQQLTTGHPIIMGRKTYQSKPLGRILPNRTNIIITRDASFTVEGAIMCSSLEDAIEKAKDSPGSDEFFIFGGGQIFKELLEKGLVDRLYLTIVKGDYRADTFFPDYTQFGFTKIIEEEKRKSDGYQYTFLTLEK